MPVGLRRTVFAAGIAMMLFGRDHPPAMIAGALVAFMAGPMSEGL